LNTTKIVKINVFAIKLKYALALKFVIARLVKAKGILANKNETPNGVLFLLFSTKNILDKPI
tara:strand:+ start:408 stop:593 length:186 start_codon:yes stop_codon:yes gene_type:complete